jgi:hypothetical protein
VSRDALYARYRQLVDDELPRRARAGRWVVTADHCLGRILLDHAVGGRWYDVLDRRPYAGFQWTVRALAEGDPLLRELDAQSLAWRGKPPKRPAQPRPER